MNLRNAKNFSSLTHASIFSFILCSMAYLSIKWKGKSLRQRGRGNAAERNTKSQHVAVASNLQKRFYSFPIHSTRLSELESLQFAITSECKLSTYQFGACYVLWHVFKRGRRWSIPFSRCHRNFTMLNWFSFTPFWINIFVHKSEGKKGSQLNLQIQFSIYHAKL